MLAQAGKRKVVVVGGGAFGCATAFELARAGDNVTLVERDGVAAYASGKSAGNLNPIIGTPAAQIGAALAAFILHAELFAELQKLGCADYVLSPVKRVHLGYDEADCRALDKLRTACQAHPAFPARWLDGATLRDMEPRLASDVQFGLLTEGSLSVSSRDFTHSLMRGAERLGTKFMFASVTGIVTRNDCAVTVQTSGGPISCDELVLATGPWVAEINNWLGIGVAVEPVKGQILRLRLRGEVPAYDFTWQSTSLYKRQHNEMLVGVTMEHCGFDLATTGAAKQLLLDRAARIMPAVKQAELLEHMASLRPMSISGDVIASLAPGWRNIYLANGGGAKGILYSAGIARSLRTLMHTGEFTTEIPENS